MARFKYSSLGFTLIELMVVVGVIGILVSLLVPAYSRYSSKARQSEAKLALGSIYAMEKSFFSEYSAYVPDLGAIGFVQEGQKHYYSLGWSAGPYAGTITGFTGGAFSNPTQNRSNIPGGTFISVCTGASIVNDLLTITGIPNDPQTFIASAAGNLRDAAPCDIWQINDLKVLQNTQIAL